MKSSAWLSPSFGYRPIRAPGRVIPPDRHGVATIFVAKWEKQLNLISKEGSYRQKGGKALEEHA